MENGSTTTPGPPPAPARFRFGLFEADPRSGELRKDGQKIRIQEQPFQILLLLLSHPGMVVSREELRQRLWSNDTFVDFDHGLNTAIRKLRDAIGDDANNPRFVQTLTRRGYRFIAPVQAEYPESGLPPADLKPPSMNHSPSGNAGVESSSVGAMGAPAVAGNGFTNQVDPQNGAPAGGDGITEVLEGQLPRPARGLTRTLFSLAQVLYLTFYVVALAQLEFIRPIVSAWRTHWGAPVMVVVLVTATIGIAVRLYLLAAVAFDYKPLGTAFRRLFPLVLPLDQLWALAPFLLLPQIGIGAAFAACAGLLYLPFSQRTLIRMTYRY